MKIFNKITHLFKSQDKKSYYNSKSIQLKSDMSLLTQVLYGDQIVTPHKAMQYYRENASVATSVDMIADTVEQIKPCLKINEEYINDHDIIDTIINPNGFNDYKEFIGAVVRNYLLTHNSYLIALGNYKFPPLELYPINPLNVNIYSNIDGYPDSYFLNNTIANGRYDRFIESRKNVKFLKNGLLSELYHIMGYSSRSNSIQGDSPLTAIVGEIKQKIQGGKHNMALLSNSARPSMWIDFKDAPNEEELANRRQHIYETLTGAENAGLPIVTGSDGVNGTGTEITTYGTNNKDMDFAKLNEFATVTIFNRYGIPLPLVTLEASTFNNIKNAIIFFYERTVIPNIDTIFGGFTKLLKPKYKDLTNTDARITFNPESIAPLMTKRLEEIKLRKELNIETVNELRSLLPDRDDIENGDKLLNLKPEDKPEDKPENDKSKS